jgi:hypothetical protein
MPLKQPRPAQGRSSTVWASGRREPTMRRIDLACRLNPVRFGVPRSPPKPHTRTVSTWRAQGRARAAEQLASARRFNKRDLARPHLAGAAMGHCAAQSRREQSRRLVGFGIPALAPTSKLPTGANEVRKWISFCNKVKPPLPLRSKAGAGARYSRAWKPLPGNSSPTANCR